MRAEQQGIRPEREGRQLFRPEAPAQGTSHPNDYRLLHSLIHVAASVSRNPGDCQIFFAPPAPGQMAYHEIKVTIQVSKSKNASASSSSHSPPSGDSQDLHLSLGTLSFRIY
jgi:hypothetical protein